MSGTEKKNYLAMSDEDFMALPELLNGVEAEAPAPQQVQEEPKPDDITQVTTEVIDPNVSIDPVVEAEKSDDEIAAELAAKEVDGLSQETEEEKKAREEKEATDKAASELTPEQKAEADKAAEDAAKAGEEPDYKAFYEALVGKPIKGGKREIQIKTPEEAIKLMQMGAGFGRKMHDIQPHLKTLRFLEANGLLNVDQTDLAYLVDLKNKNPDAIKKLVKDSGIDPLDFNNDEPVNYRSNISQVTDEEVNFREALKDLTSQEGGIETVSVIEKTWDTVSHEALMKEPELLGVIQQHRETGIYDRIADEVERQRALGNIPHGTPFLQAYQQVGNHLRDTNGFADLVEKAAKADTLTPGKVALSPAPVVQPQVLATKVSAPKPSVSNNDKANAAAATKTTPRRSAPLINPMAMSDEEFAKQFPNL